MRSKRWWLLVAVVLGMGRRPATGERFVDADEADSPAKLAELEAFLRDGQGRRRLRETRVEPWHDEVAAGDVRGKVGGRARGPNGPKLSTLCSDDLTEKLRRRMKRRETQLAEREAQLERRQKHLDALAARLSGGGAGEPRKRNVLLILADDLRPQLGCYGHREVKTPNLDAFAKRSTRFRRAYCQAPSCNPSRNSFLTGRRPDATQIYFFEGSAHQTMGADATTLPRFFRWHGYEAFGVGKVFHWEPWDNSFSSRNGRYYPKDYDQEWGCEAGDDPLFQHLGTCKSPAYRAGCPKHGGCDTSLPYDDDLPEEFFFDHRVATKAIQLLREAKAYQTNPEDKPGPATPEEKPFFMAVGFHSPHTMWHFPHRFWNETYGPVKDFPLPERRTPPAHCPPLAVGHEMPSALHTYDGASVDPDRWMFQEGMPDLDGEAFAKDPLLRQAMGDARKFYASSVSFLDEQVGRVLREVEALGLDNDTVIAFTTDHGYSLGEGARWGKYTLFESDTRVPLMVRDPSQPASWGRTTKQIAELVDLMPTLADLAGLPMTRNPAAAGYEWMDGASLGDVIRYPDGDEGAKHVAFTVQPRCMDVEDDGPYADDTHTCLGFSDEWHLRHNHEQSHLAGPVLGVSMRVDGWRFTRWMYWDHKANAIDWDREPYAEELYEHPEDHRDDESINVFNTETINVVANEEHSDMLDSMRGFMRHQFDSDHRLQDLGFFRARVDADGKVTEARYGPFGGRPGLFKERMQEEGW